MTKQELRKQYLQKRLALSEAEYRTLNRRLCENFFRQVDLSSVHTLHTFLPIKKNKEPDTWLIIEHLKQEHPSIKIAIPKINRDDVMDSFLLEREQLEINSWGIPEPVNGEIVDPTKIDLVIVPLLVVDKRGHRIGYGKAYYDKFLNACRKDCRKIGLSFFEPIAEIPELFEHDLAVDRCITPNSQNRRFG